MGEVQFFQGIFCLPHNQVAGSVRFGLGRLSQAFGNDGGTLLGIGAILFVVCYLCLDGLFLVFPVDVRQFPVQYLLLQDALLVGVLPHLFVLAVCYGVSLFAGGIHFGQRLLFLPVDVGLLFVVFLPGHRLAFLDAFLHQLYAQSFHRLFGAEAGFGQFGSVVLLVLGSDVSTGFSHRGGVYLIGQCLVFFTQTVHGLQIVLQSLLPAVELSCLFRQSFHGLRERACAGVHNGRPFFRGFPISGFFCVSVDPVGVCIDSLLQLIYLIIIFFDNFHG